MTVVSLQDTFPPFFNSSIAGQGILTDFLMRGYHFIFHKHLPLHSSVPSISVLRFWHCQCWRHSTESWESEVQGWRAVVILHLIVHFKECWPHPSGRGTDIHTTLHVLILQWKLSLSHSHAYVGSSTVTLNRLILTGLQSYPCQKTFHMT